MLRVDLTKSDLELSQIITKLCSIFGIVRSIKIYRSPAAFALVEMASQAETLALALRYGGSAFGSSVLIHLEQESHVG